MDENDQSGLLGIRTSGYLGQREHVMEAYSVSQVTEFVCQTQRTQLKIPKAMASCWFCFSICVSLCSSSKG
jgi:hypothetical protein